jgi:hypothetical protein
MRPIASRASSGERVSTAAKRESGVSAFNIGLLRHGLLPAGDDFQDALPDPDIRLRDPDCPPSRTRGS